MPALFHRVLRLAGQPATLTLLALSLGLLRKGNQALLTELDSESF